MEKSRKLSLSKSERLCSEKEISTLFTSGDSFFIYPFKVIWRQSLIEQDFPVKILFAVSKKNLKLSSQRNFIKRLMRESFRLNKFELYDYLSSKGMQISLGLVFVGKKGVTYKEMDHKIKEIIKRLAKLEKH